MRNKISALGVKKILSFILLLTLSLGLAPSFANAVECNPSWNGDWTISEDCDFPVWYTVNCDMALWGYTVTVKNNVTMWFDLSTNKITFTTWQIRFLGATSKMDNTVPVSARYYETLAYTSGVGDTMTGCPAGMYVFYDLSPTIPTTPGTHYMVDQTATNSANTSKTATEINDGIASSGTMYCWHR